MAIAFDKTLGSALTSLVTTGAAVANSRIVLFVSWYNGTARTVTGFSAGGGLTWVVDSQYTMGSSDPITGIGVAICSADAPSGLASSTTLTPTMSGSVSAGPACHGASFTGLATGASGYLDVASTVDMTGSASYTTGSMATTNAEDLLVSIAMSGDWDAHAATGSGTEIHDLALFGTDLVGTQRRIVSSTGSYTLTGTFSTGGLSYQMNLAVAYKGLPPATPDVDPSYTDFPKPKLRSAGR